MLPKLRLVLRTFEMEIVPPDSGGGTCVCWGDNTFIKPLQSFGSSIFERHDSIYYLPEDTMDIET